MPLILDFSGDERKKLYYEIAVLRKNFLAYYSQDTS